FGLWLFSGLVMWNFFAAVSTGCMAWLISAGALLRKIYFPPQTPLVAGTLATLAQTGIELGILVAILIMVGNSSPVFLVLPLLVVLLVGFSLGVGLLASVLNV